MTEIFKLAKEHQPLPHESEDEYHARIYRHAMTMKDQDEGLTFLICGFITWNGEEITQERVDAYINQGLAAVAVSTEEETIEAKEYTKRILSDSKNKMN